MSGPFPRICILPLWRRETLSHGRFCKFSGFGGLSFKRTASAWSPLHEPLFRSLWAASLISYTGTWMQNVGAGWLMTQLTLSPLMISLVQAAATVPVFLAILPAGVLADLVDRRRFLIITQTWMVLSIRRVGRNDPLAPHYAVDIVAVYFSAWPGRGNE